MLVFVLVLALILIAWYANRAQSRKKTAPLVQKAPLPTPAEVRTYLVATRRGDLAVANVSRGFESDHFVGVENADSDFDGLFTLWIGLRPERETILFLSADPVAPDEPSHVIVTDKDTGTCVGRLPAVEARLYHGIVSALAERGLPSASFAKVFGDTGSRSRVSLKLNLDSPQRIAADFCIPDVQWMPPSAPTTPPPTPTASRPPASNPAPHSTSSLATGQGHFYLVAGASHYQDALRRVLAAAPDGHFVARLVPEPENPHDPHAIAVRDADGATFAYLRAEDAPAYGRLLAGLPAQDIVPVCPAMIVGGDVAGSTLNVRLDLDRPTIIAHRYGFRLPRQPRGPKGERRDA